MSFPTPESNFEHHPKSFVPLESNPDVFNAFLEKLGVQGVEFTDVYGLDPDLLAFVPRPVRAIILVFPVSEAYEQYRHEHDQKPYAASSANWSRQTIRNACGTMAILHALANGVPAEALGDGDGATLIKEFNALPAEGRPEYLEKSDTLEQIHGSVASTGVTQAPQADADIENHYICLTKSLKQLVELDGRRKGPIVREDNVDEEDLLAIPQTLNVIREFLDRESGNTQFAMLALVDRT